jgi:hypothetical protein
MRDMSCVGWNVLNQNSSPYVSKGVSHAGKKDYRTKCVTKSTIFWDITPCSTLKVNRRFGEILPPSSGSNELNKISAWKQVAVTRLSTYFHSDILLDFCLPACWLQVSMHPEGPATGRLDTGVSWFPSAFKEILRCFPSSKLLLRASHAAFPTSIHQN